MNLKTKNWFERKRQDLDLFYIKLRAYIFQISYSFFVKIFLVKNSESKSANILIVNTEKLGDLVLSLQFISNVVSVENGKNVFLLTDIKFNNGYFSENKPFKTFAVDTKKYKRSLTYRIVILNSLRKFNFKKVLNISPSRGILNDEITLNCLARFTTGVVSFSKYLPSPILKQNNARYNFVLHSDEINESTRLHLLFQSVYGSVYSKQNSFTELISCKETQLDLADKFILIAPSSSESIRNWSTEKFKMLANKLAEKSRVILLGTEEQTSIINFISDGNRIKGYAGNFSFAECVYLIKNSSLFIGLDSGFTHIAQLFGKPYVAIIGGGNFNRFFPYTESENSSCEYFQLDCFNCEWNCSYIQPYCLSLVEVEQVYKNCIELMERN
ncbi:MAG: hypothetical protein IPM56_05960 [Ignavibacteriales bacterium]|nr:MAG: hypothetical protein IPM56_05960 [Ignavibacteriales bacterium]